MQLNVRWTHRFDQERELRTGLSVCPADSDAANAFPAKTPQRPANPLSRDNEFPRSASSQASFDERRDPDPSEDREQPPCGDKRLNRAHEDDQRDREGHAPYGGQGPESALRRGDMKRDDKFSRRHFRMIATISGDRSPFRHGV